MPGDPRTIIERLTGKRYHDIELPNDSGQVDPRLKGKSVRERLDKIRPSLAALKKTLNDQK